MLEGFKCFIEASMPFRGSLNCSDTTNKAFEISLEYTAHRAYILSVVKVGFYRAASTNFKFRADYCNSKLVATFPNDGELIYYSNPGAKIHYFLEFNSYKIIIFTG